MSWIALIIIVMLAAFGCTYAFCEWLIHRARAKGDGPPASS